MRRLPDGTFHCPACGSEVLPRRRPLDPFGVTQASRITGVSGATRRDPAAVLRRRGRGEREGSGPNGGCREEGETGRTTVARVSVEARSATARFRVRIQAPSIGRAIELAAALRPAEGGAAPFPIDRAGSFAEDPVGIGRRPPIETGEPRKRAA